MAGENLGSGDGVQTRPRNRTCRNCRAKKCHSKITSAQANLSRCPAWKATAENRKFRCHKVMRRRCPIEIPAQFGKLPRQPVKDRLLRGLLTGFGAPPVVCRARNAQRQPRLLRGAAWLDSFRPARPFRAQPSLSALFRCFNESFP